MGGPTAAGSGGKSVGSDVSGNIASADPSGGLGGIDPSFGAAAGGGWDPSGIGGDGGGGGGGFGGFGGQIPGDPTGSYGAMQNIGGQGQLGAPGQGAPTDQPGATLQPWPQQANASASTQRPPDVGYALMNGAGSHPELLNATPGGQQFASLTPPGNPLPAADPAPEDNIDPSQRPEWSGSVHQFKATDANESEPWAPLPNTRLQSQNATFNERFAAAPTSNIPTPQPRPPLDAAGNIPTPQARPPLDAAGNIPTPQARPDVPATAGGEPPPDRSGYGGPATEQSAPGTGGQGQTAGGGSGMQSPLEQIIGQFMHMLTGGRGGLQGLMGPLEQMLMHALGINPHQLFPQFYGGGFNPPAPAPGSGYFPAGTTGGRTVQPGGQQTPARPGSPPQAPPGPPGSPGNPPSALPPGRRLNAPGPWGTTTTGYPYTADKPDQPPPWYPGGPGTKAGSGAQPEARPSIAASIPGAAKKEMPQSAFDRNNKSIPAPIRYANPGGQASSARAKQLWGSTDAQILHPGRGQTGAGRSFGIAGFPTPSHGLASNMDLLATSRAYRGQTIGNAIHTWSGGYRSTVPGYSSNQRITDQMLKDPKFMIPFFREMQKAEAGRVWMTPDQEQRGFDMYMAGSAQAYEQTQRARQIQSIRYQPQGAKSSEVNGSYRMTEQNNTTTVPDQNSHKPGQMWQEGPIHYYQYLDESGKPQTGSYRSRTPPPEYFERMKPFMDNPEFHQPYGIPS